mmetsp:Transcript_16578/g.18437  ORF Transcript_16578/g.18437 Transcript_16578/m.18437 type:complete len:510 (+) Transcript_16578:62-1591(+)
MDIVYCVGKDFQHCGGSFASITDYASWDDSLGDYVCNTSLEAKNVNLYTFSLQWAPVLLVPVLIACFVLIIVTLPCDSEWKRWIERLISYLDLKPSSYWVQEEQLESFLDLGNYNNVNDVDDAVSRTTGPKIRTKQRRSVIAGWITLFAFVLFLAAAVYSTLLYTDPRNNMLVPHMEAAKSHIEYRNNPHQPKLNIQVLIKNCEVSYCANKSFDIRLDNKTKIDPICIAFKTQTGATYCHLTWESVAVLYDDRSNIRTLERQLLFDMERIGNVSVYLISSSLAYDSNFHRHNGRAEDIFTFARYQMQSKVSNYLYKSYAQCLDTFQDNDGTALVGMFRRIHFSPVSYIFDRTLHREIISQGVFWVEMKYPPLRDVARRQIELTIQESSFSWYYETAGVTSLIVQIIVMASAALAIPPVMKRALTVITKRLTNSAKGLWLTIALSVLPVVIVIASIVIFTVFHPEKTSPELFNTLLCIFMFFGTMVIIILIRIAYAMVGCVLHRRNRTVQ